MSQIVTTSVGRFRRVSIDDQSDTWLFECPGCGEWAYLDNDQWNGRVSVDHASDGCHGKYHETHEYGKELLATIQARVWMGEQLCDVEK